jgi:hypothetical protein
LLVDTQYQIVQRRNDDNFTVDLLRYVLGGGNSIHDVFHTLINNGTDGTDGTDEIINRTLYSDTGRKEVADPDVVENLTIVNASEAFNASNSSNSSNTCSICITDFTPDEKIVKLECEHTFHIDCIKQWFKQDHICPLCRKSVNKKESSNSVSSITTNTTPDIDTNSISESESENDYELQTALYYSLMTKYTGRINDHRNDDLD